MRVIGVARQPEDAAALVAAGADIVPSLDAPTIELLLDI
jgi:hypothetical protein